MSEPTLTVVHAEPREQAGEKILVGKCPHCGYTFGVCAPGQIVCRCGNRLDFQPPTERR